MNIGYLFGLLVLPLSIPLVNLALSRKQIGVKKRRNLRVFYFVFGILSCLALFMSSVNNYFEYTNHDNERLLAFAIIITTYIFCYKTVVRRNFKIKLLDYDDTNTYIKDLAKSYDIKYPLTENIILAFGDLPKVEQYHSAVEWSDALKSYFEKIKSA